MILLFINGIITGMILSLPFGPIGIYCMEKILVDNEKKGYSAAMGMVTVDFIYGFIAFMFINILRHDIEKYGPLLTSLVGLFLITVGVRKAFKQQEKKEIKERDGGLFQEYLTIFLVAVVNIPTIIVIIGIYTISNNLIEIPTHTLHLFSLNLYYKLLGAFIFSLGILVGGSTSWGITTYILSHCKKNISHNSILKTTKITGILLIGFGFFTLFNSIFYFFKLRGNF